LPDCNCSGLSRIGKKDVPAGIEKADDMPIKHDIKHNMGMVRRLKYNKIDKENSKIQLENLQISRIFLDENLSTIAPPNKIKTDIGMPIKLSTIPNTQGSGDR
jgi:hypothetical protein